MSIMPIGTLPLPLPLPPIPAATEATYVAASNTTPTTPQIQPDHTRSLWHSRLGTALRTALACAIVGCATLYSPPAVRRYLTFPAFAYMTAILITGEAALGDVLRGVACALYATALGALPAGLTLVLIRPAHFSIPATALAVALSSFVVSLTGSGGSLTKRIAMGQIVIVYVAAFQDDDRTNGAVVIPVHVAASTAVGAVASVLALVFPYPRVACYEVREKGKLYTEIALERLRLLVDAVCSTNSTRMLVSLSQAQSLTTCCAKLLQNIKLKQVSIHWERPPFRFLQTNTTALLSDRLQAIEVPLKGMEVALSSTSLLHTNTSDQQLKDHLHSQRDLIILRLSQDHYTSEREMINKPLQPFHHIPHNLHDLPPFFFLFCMKLLYSGAPTAPMADTSKVKTKSIWATERLMVALKCSLSLGFAVLFGILFSKDNGYWSGLTVAIGITPWRAATFKTANVRAQGTALGSVYGVLGSMVSQNLMEIRFLVLLPWVILTSFLRRSRMFGHAGGFAAIISAMIIIGRRNFGSPTAFSIARLTETFIGLWCSISVELLLQPTRASTIARAELSKSLRMLEDSMVVQLKEAKLREQVSELMKCIEEAEVEPNFWFLPFPTACYKKLHCCLYKMVELVVFMAHGVQLLDHQGAIDGDLEHIKKLVGSSVRSFEEVIGVKSLRGLEKELEIKRSKSTDLELGKTKSLYGYGDLSTGEEECEKAMACYLRHAGEVVERLDEGVDGEMKSQVVLCLAAVGFCMDGLMRETREMEKGVMELVQWENPASHVNLYGISCKIKELYT